MEPKEPLKKKKKTRGRKLAFSFPSLLLLKGKKSCLQSAATAGRGEDRLLLPDLKNPPLGFQRSGCPLQANVQKVLDFSLTPSQPPTTAMLPFHPTSLLTHSLAEIKNNDSPFLHPSCCSPGYPGPRNPYNPSIGVVPQARPQRGELSWALAGLAELQGFPV